MARELGALVIETGEGFLDGRLGLVLALLDAESTYYRFLKMWLSDVARCPLPPPPKL